VKVTWLPYLHESKQELFVLSSWKWRNVSRQHVRHFMYCSDASMFSYGHTECL